MADEPAMDRAVPLRRRLGLALLVMGIKMRKEPKEPQPEIPKSLERLQGMGPGKAFLAGLALADYQGPVIGSMALAASTVGTAGRLAGWAIYTLLAFLRLRAIEHGPVIPPQPVLVEAIPDALQRGTREPGRVAPAGAGEFDLVIDGITRQHRGNALAADRLTAVGHGATRPVAANDSDENKALNRRTEIEVL